MRYLLRRLVDGLGFSPGSTDTSLGHLTVVLALRAVVLLGATARFAIHFNEYAARPQALGLELAALGLFAAHVAALAWLRQRQRRLFVAEATQIASILVDCLLLSVLYFLTGEIESDFFLFFVIPILLPTTMNWRWRSLLSPVLTAACLFAIVMVMPRFYEYPPEAAGWLRNLLRVFAPRMGFLLGVALLVNLINEYRRDAANEARQKQELEELMDRMRRQAAVAPAAAPAAQGRAEGIDGLSVGQKLGHRYKLLSVLGVGGMGKVYQAQDLELDDIVALKLLVQTAMPEGTQGIVTLKQEIRLQRRITHQNVVRVHDLGSVDGLQFLTMEYVPGTTLEQMLARQTRLPVGPGLQVFKQLCSGLQAIHSGGILHRDIKPANVMVLPNGKVKLMDFGVAQLIQDLRSAARDGLVVGSPLYMSPEQIQRQPLDARSDVYSLGVIMFEAFSGRHPFPSEAVRDVIRHQVLTPAPRPVPPDGELPQGLERLILACLAKQAKDRPGSAQAVYAALLEVGE